MICNFTRHYLGEYSEIQFCFNRIQHEIQSEDFIVIGSLIENFFKSNCNFFFGIVDILLILYDKGLINSESIRHGYKIFDELTF